MFVCGTGCVCVMYICEWMEVRRRKCPNKEERKFAGGSCSLSSLSPSACVCVWLLLLWLCGLFPWASPTRPEHKHKLSHKHNHEERKRRTSLSCLLLLAVFLFVFPLHTHTHTQERAWERGETTTHPERYTLKRPSSSSSNQRTQPQIRRRLCPPPLHLERYHYIHKQAPPNKLIARTPALSHFPLAAAVESVAQDAPIPNPCFLPFMYSP